MSRIKASSVFVLSAVLVGCTPGIYRTWTVERGPADAVADSHIAAGEKFSIAKAGAGSVIRPEAELARRWGFTEKPLTRARDLYCVEVDLGPAHAPGDDDPHSLHWFTFAHPVNDNARRLRIEYFPKQSERHGCDVPTHHLGVLHAED